MAQLGTNLIIDSFALTMIISKWSAIVQQMEEQSTKRMLYWWEEARLMYSIVGVLGFRQQLITWFADTEVMFHQVHGVAWWKFERNAVWVQCNYSVPNHGAQLVQAMHYNAQQMTKKHVDPVGERPTNLPETTFVYDASSVDDTAIAIQLVPRLRNIRSDGGFRLTKWLSKWSRCS